MAVKLTWTIRQCGVVSRNIAGMVDLAQPMISPYMNDPG
jgi:hypothetical protein